MDGVVIIIHHDVFRPLFQRSFLALPYPTPGRCLIVIDIRCGDFHYERTQMMRFDAKPCSCDRLCIDALTGDDERLRYPSVRRERLAYEENVKEREENDLRVQRSQVEITFF
ncbi:hypothetical protein Tco_0880708 [Tanacetum coccineum]